MPKTVYSVTERDLERRDTFPDRAGGAVDPCRHAGGNGVAAAFKGEAAFANGCKYETICTGTS
jgi:hypothetical protein